MYTTFAAIIPADPEKPTVANNCFYKFCVVILIIICIALLTFSGLAILATLPKLPEGVVTVGNSDVVLVLNFTSSDVDDVIINQSDDRVAANIYQGLYKFRNWTI